MPTTATDHLADNVKAIRETRGLSQQQIAKIAGIPRATWTNLESGAANPTLAVLVKVAAAQQIRRRVICRVARNSEPGGRG